MKGRILKMENKHYLSKSPLLSDLIFIGDIAIGLDESLDCSEESSDKMRQAALAFVFSLVGEKLDDLWKVRELMEHSIDSLSAMPSVGSTDPIVEDLRECFDILFSRDDEEENEDSEDEADDEDGEEDGESA